MLTLSQKLAAYKHGNALQAISVLWLGTVGGSLLAVSTKVVLARTLEVEQFGEFSAALATVTLAAALAGFGVPGFWLYSYGKEGWNAGRWLPGSFRFLKLSAGTSVAVILLWAWLGPHGAGTALVLSVLAAFVVGQAMVELAGAKFQLEGRHTRLAIWQFTPHALRFTGALVVLIAALLLELEANALHAAVAFSAASLIVFLIGVRELAKMPGGSFRLEGHGGRPERTEGNRPGAIAVLRHAWLFGATSALYIVYLQSSIVFLRYFVGEHEAGLFAGAMLVMLAVYLLPMVVYKKFFLPRMHRWAHHEKERLARVYYGGNRAMLLLGAVFAVGILLLARPMVPIVFGQSYRGAAPVLMVLALAAPFRFFAAGAGAVITTGGLVRAKMVIMALAAGANVALNLALIPRFGLLGAAVAVVATEAGLAIAFHARIRAHFARVL